MNTQKHDMMMIRHVPVTVGELAELAHEANALQADAVAEADAHRYTRDSLLASNEARAVLVSDLHRLDAELDSERSAFGVMEQSALTLRSLLEIERAKHARATAHIARMATGRGWLPGKTNPITAAIDAVTRADEERQERLALIAESKESPKIEEPRPFKVGDRVEVITSTHGARFKSGKGVVVEAVSQDTIGVDHDDEQNGARWWYQSDELRHIEWEPGEGIEVGVEVEYVGNDKGHTMTRDRVGARGTVRSVSVGGQSAVVTGLPGNSLLINLRRVS